MDPLAILKEFCLNGQLDLIEIEDDRVKFGDKYSFPKQQPTAFKSKEGQGDHYGLEAVAFFIKQIVANPAMGPYVAAVQRNKIPAIDFKDREVGSLCVWYKTDSANKDSQQQHQPLAGGQWQSTPLQVVHA